MPYRVDIRDAGDQALERLIELGALDIDSQPDGPAALMPDSVTPETVAAALGAGVTTSPAIGRDAGSVWILNPRPIQIGRVRIVPASDEHHAGALRMTDSAAFGTGLHPTTALCLEALDDAIAADAPEAVLDVGTGSGVLALAALTMGVPRATGVDIDADALRAAAENARLNALERRLQLAHGGPDAITGTWPLVVANVLAAPLIEMAPALVRRVGHHGLLVLSGIPASVQQQVDDAYRHRGMRHVRAMSRAGWIALILRASW